LSACRDRKATAISLLVVLGMRADGQKVLLAIRSMGGESAEAWRAVLDRLKALDARVCAVVKQNADARLFMTAPGVGTVTALSVASAYDDAARFRRPSSAGAISGSHRAATSPGR